MQVQSKPVVIARLTAIRNVGVRTIIEVCEDASFQNFYRYYTQDGRRRSTKKLIRIANRNEGLQPWHRAYRLQPGLEVIAERMRTGQQFVSVKVRVLKKRKYQQLLNAAAVGVTVKRQPDPRLLPQPILRIPVRIPESHTTLQKRWSILAGRG